MQTQVSKAVEYVSLTRSPTRVSSLVIQNSDYCKQMEMNEHVSGNHACPAKRPRTFWDTVLSDSGCSNNTSTCTTVPNMLMDDADANEGSVVLTSSPLPSQASSPSHSGYVEECRTPDAEFTGGSASYAGRVVKSGVKGGIEKPHTCTTCKSSFARQSHLRLHVRTIHDKLKPFQCDECPATFGHVSSKYRHYRTVHLKRRDFACDRCGQTFAERSAVQKHTRTVHEGARPYPCRICGFRFHFKLHLAQHIATVHEKLRPHQCVVCNSCFGQRSSLNRHVRQIHGLATSGCAVKAEDNKSDMRSSTAL